jgi:hypothetical protein
VLHFWTALYNQRNDTFIPKHRKTIGRITNYDGESIVGARVGVDSVQIEKPTQRSIPEGMDPMAISDANGVFILTSETPFTTLDLAISAREYAPLKMTGIEPGKHWIIQMTEGVTIRGRVLKNNKPVSGTTMVLDGIYRSDDFYARHSELATNAEGYFEFLNMPPLTDYYLRGKMDDSSPHGALEPLWVTTKGDGTLVDVGNLQITPDLRIAGRLILDSKAALPPDTKIVITTERGWDRSETIVAENGQFELAGLPLDRYRISVQIPNHRLAIENPNLNLFNGSHLEGTLNTNLENLTILVEAGPQHTRGNLRKTQRLLNRSRGGPFRNPIEIPSRFRFPEN